MSVAAYDLSPLLGVVGVGLLVAIVPFTWFRLRQRGATPAARLRALTLLTLFLCFDLVMLGAYTRLSDSGLGCPDWPGCYGHASPVGAHSAITEAQASAPLGPVTHEKAWVEMAHRYSATAIGLLIATLAVLSIVANRRGKVRVSPWWPVATLAWICVQGAFGALTVTMNLYPAIVVMHLLGGMVLLALLALQFERYEPRALLLSPPLRAGLVIVALLAAMQIALGGWVSTNYAVLACREFPTCQGVWWPDSDFASGFVLRRPLGMDGSGGALPYQALTAIHMAHRVGALLVLPALALLAWRLFVRGRDAMPWAAALAAIVLWQAASGLGNLLLGWPLIAAVAHTAGSAALVVVMTLLLARARSTRPEADARWPARAGAATS
ncbi:MAG: COX15/CtaA family protein [Caldimonas sp.]